MMVRKSPAPSPAGSLDRQISDVEERLALRRQSSKVHASALGQRLRDKLSSPVTLLIAAGVGFAAGHFNPFRKSGASARVDESGAGRHRLLATIMEALSLAGTLMAMLPAIEAARKPEPSAAGDTTQPRCNAAERGEGGVL